MIDAVRNFIDDSKLSQGERTAGEREHAESSGQICACGQTSGACSLMLANARSCGLDAKMLPKKINGKELLETDKEVGVGLKITTYNN
jgi:hypothetical protein